MKDSVLTSSDTLRVHVEIANTGKMDGKEVVQLYFRDVVSSVTTPIKQLKAFKKVSVKAGDQVKLLLEVPVSEFGLYNEKMEYKVEPGEFDIQIGSASDKILFHKNITVK